MVAPKKEKGEKNVEQKNHATPKINVASKDKSINIRKNAKKAHAAHKSTSTKASAKKASAKTNIKTSAKLSTRAKATRADSLNYDYKPTSQPLPTQDGQSSHPSDIFGMNFSSIPETMYDLYNNNVEIFGEMYDMDSMNDMFNSVWQQTSANADDGIGQSNLVRSATHRLKQYQDLAKNATGSIKQALDKSEHENLRWFREGAKDYAALYRDVMRSADEQEKLDSIYKYLIAQIDNNKIRLENIVKERYLLLSRMLSLQNGHFSDWARIAYNTMMETNNIAKKPHAGHN